jgi:hypothetical protein
VIPPDGIPWRLMLPKGLMASAAWLVSEPRRLGGRARADHAARPSRLPTARSLSRLGFTVRDWCKACQHSVDADLAALIRDGHGDKPLAHVKWRCANCGSRRTDVVMGSHVTPKA